MIGERLVLYPWNSYGGHLVLVHLSISLEHLRKSYNDILMGQIPLATTIQTFDPDHLYFTQKSIGVHQKSLSTVNMYEISSI